MTTASISPAELHEQIKSGRTVTLIDVRTPAEYEHVHVACARNIPLDRLQLDDLSQCNREGSPVYVICKSGGRGGQACMKLSRAGLANVMNVEGGTEAWEQAGFPVLRGRSSMSLDRQVRIIAGGLIVVASVLGMIHDVRWGILVGVVGLGLAHAGATNSCLMGMMLSKMPWNCSR